MKNVPNLRFSGFSDEWEEAKLEKNIEYVSSGKTKVKSEKGKYKVFGSTGIIGYTDVPDYEGEHILIARVGANAGYINKINEECGISDNTLVLKCNNNLNNDFLAYKLDEYKLSRLIFGSGQPLITGGQIKDLKFKLPIIIEQEKIANFLTKVDKLIEKQDEKVNNLEQYKKGMMQKIFSQEIRFKNDDGGEYPEWKYNKLGKITKLTDGVHFTPEYVESGVPFWSVETIVSNVEPKYITEEAHQLAIKRCHPQKDDILITRIGTLAKSIVIADDKDISIYVSVALIKSSNKFNSTYLKQYFDSEEYYKEFLSKSLLTATPKKINMEDLKDTIVKLPCLEEQTKIANFLSKIASIVEKEKEKLEELRQWKKGLLQGMFI